MTRALTYGLAAATALCMYLHFNKPAKPRMYARASGETSQLLTDEGDLVWKESFCFSCGGAHCRIRNADDAAAIFRNYYYTFKDHESFLAMFLDADKTHICTEVFSVGGKAEAFVDLDMIMSRARHHNARFLWIAHNHPSDRLWPSGADKEVTEAFEQACAGSFLTFVDHLICSKEDYYSFKMGRSTRDPAPLSQQQVAGW